MPNITLSATAWLYHERRMPDFIVRPLMTTNKGVDLAPKLLTLIQLISYRCDKIRLSLSRGSNDIFQYKNYLTSFLGTLSVYQIPSTSVQRFRREK